MPRCNDCNKFVSLDTEQDPEVDLRVDDDGEVNWEATIVNTCAECGSDVRTASLDGTVGLGEYADEEEWKKHLRDHHGFEGTEGESVDGVSLEVEDTGSERTTRQEGKGSRAPTFYGVNVHFEVKCSCGHWSAEGECGDDIQASSMDEC